MVLCITAILWMNLENLNSHWLNRVMNTTAYQGERKVKEQKICGEGGHSWACKREVTISIEQCMKSTLFFWQYKKEDHMNNKKLRMLSKHVCKSMILPAVLRSRLHIFFVLTCHPNVVSQFVNREAGASGGVRISDCVMLCCHCITDSVSAQFPLRVR